MRKKEVGKKALSHIDYSLLFITLILVMIGLLMVFSSSVIMAEVKWKSPYMFIVKQIIWISIGLSAMFLFSRFDYHYFQKLAKPSFLISVALLLLVLIVGVKIGGARRWLRWGFMSFQPSEFAKLIMVIVLADYLDRKKSQIQKWEGLWPPFFMMGILCFLIALEPDLGTPILIVMVGMSMLFVAGSRLWHLLLICFASIPFIAFEILRKPYRLMRIKSFFSSWWDIDSGSYQLTQSILALGSGGFFGKGLAQGQIKMMYLPEAHTDFIFTIIGEELGFLGSVIIISLFVVFAWKGFKIAKSNRDYFGGLLATGIMWMIIFQVIVNIGVACGLLPTKGLPLPFVSFGGSALVFNLIGVGILLNISRYSIKSKI